MCGLPGLALIALLAPEVQAGMTDGLVEGDNGVLHVFGVLTESACRLEMPSADQTVDMGSVATGDLQDAGQRGTPVAVQLRLRDCIRGAANNLDTLGNVSWSTSQPAMSLTFVSELDEVNPQLVRANGVNGMGLRLTDSTQRDMVLGQPAKPVFLSPGSDVLTYYITPERTADMLEAGVYFANVNFRLSYE
jgi:type 1 fimbria pilin